MFQSVRANREEIEMLTAVRWYRVASAKPRGPWRDQLDDARRDAVELGLGCFDEDGQYFDVVPGHIQTQWAIEDQAAA